MCHPWPLVHFYGLRELGLGENWSTTKLSILRLHYFWAMVDFPCPFPMDLRVVAFCFIFLLAALEVLFLLTGDWPTSKATLFLSSNSQLLSTAHPTWEISCPTGNYIAARGWKFVRPCPLLKKYMAIIPYMSPNCEGTSVQMWIFSSVIVSQTASLFWIPPFFLSFCTFPPCQKKSNLMLTFSRKNLARAQMLCFSYATSKIFD